MILNVTGGGEIGDQGKPAWGNVNTDYIAIL